MRFQLSLHAASGSVLPINYQYPLSAAVYKTLQKGDAEYAEFLHEEGYGKGYKLFTFSDLKGRFKVRGDRLELLSPNVELLVHFHLPEASRTFVEGLFRSETIDVADQKTKARFAVRSVVSLPNPLKGIDERQVTQVLMRPISMVVAGDKREDGRYDYLAPDDPRFANSLLHNWRGKIAACYDGETAEGAVLAIDVEAFEKPWRSRLVRIKAGTSAETQIRGFLNFKLRLTAERRFVDLLVNGGVGLYTAQGMGCLGVVG